MNVRIEPEHELPARRPTIADVAQRAGVSATTVSFVINDKPDGRISEPTRRAVLNAVDQLGYRPNRTAQWLRTRKTQTIGFVTDEIAVAPPAGRTISGALDVSLAHGSRLLVMNTTRDQRVVTAAIDDLIDRQVDAIIFAVVGTRRTTLPEAVKQIPTLLVNCFVADNRLPCVLPDEAAGGQAAAEMLIDAGHRKLAFLTGLRGSWATRQRLKGYRAAVGAAGIPFSGTTVLAGNFRTDSGYELMQRILAGPERPTGILCGNDRMALGAYLALLEAGLRVPEDVSVVGYDDQVDLAQEVHPPMSTIGLPYYEMGSWAATTIFSGQVGAAPPRTYVPCRVVPRQSVAAPRA